MEVVETNDGGTGLNWYLGSVLSPSNWC